MNIDITSPALLFPAISLLLLAFTNRFLALATLIRKLHDNYMEVKDQRLLGQIKNLRRRLLYIRLMQAFGIGSMFMCVFTMFLLFAEFQSAGRFVFGVSLVLMLLSLAMSFIEVQLSSKALIIHLSDLGEQDLKSTEPNVKRLWGKIMGSSKVILLLIAFFTCSNQLQAQQMANGEFTEMEQLADSLASLQLKGYNERNIELFLLAYSDSVEVYGFSDELRYKGKDKMRERYADMFANTPDLHCHIEDRIVFGNHVIDHELVTRDKDKPKVKAVAIYEISNGKIQKVWFLNPY